MREEDIELARTVHYGFMRRRFDSDDLDVAASVRPQADVGGDYCSIFPVDDDRLIVCLCDALGHSVAAALYAARVNTFVLTHARESAHPCDLIESLNEFLCMHLPFSGMFATFFSIFFDRREKSFVFAGAGHPPALHYEQATGRVLELASGTIMLGVSHPLAVACSVNRRPLAAGDKILLYTDGLSEGRTPAGDLFGTERIATFLAEHQALESGAFNERLLAEVDAKSGVALTDDVLLMTVTVK